MKRIFALLLALLLLAALTGCWPLEEQYTEKPVIYLYPEAETDVTVRLDYVGDLTCTYPAYDGAWRVAAAPDGTLTDESGQTYRYLYWEGTDNVQYDFSEGFCAYTDAAKLTITPQPDTLLRVFMAWKPLTSAVEIAPQTLTAPERTGFTAVEWGGAKVQ